MANFNWPIIGHQNITNYLQTVIQNNTLGHAYLFYGPNSLGKSLVADYFIQTIFCDSKNSLPCGSCMHCRQILKQVHPDVIYLTKEEDKKNITVEQVREVRSKTQRGTFLNSHKVVLIQQADKLSLAASNALLKILEEPTQKTVFIFLTPSLNNIPATILSRMQIIKFLLVSLDEIQKYLIKQGMNKEHAYELSRLSGGFPGKVVHFMNHPKLLDEYKNSAQQLLTEISGDLNTRFGLIEKLSGQSNSEIARVNSKQFLQNLNVLLRDVLLIKNICFDQITHVWLKQPLSILANKYSSAKLAQLLSKARTTQKYIDQNINLRLALENLVLEF